jgi:hypothetical protein
VEDTQFGEYRDLCGSLRLGNAAASKSREDIESSESMADSGWALRPMSVASNLPSSPYARHYTIRSGCVQYFTSGRAVRSAAVWSHLGAVRAQLVETRMEPGVWVSCLARCPVEHNLLYHRLILGVPWAGCVRSTASRQGTAVVERSTLREFRARAGAIMKTLWKSWRRVV